jgi:hypothetical protein
VEIAVVAEGKEVELQALALHHTLGRHICDDNIGGPTERSKHACMFQAHRKGPTFFDEDDVC